MNDSRTPALGQPALKDLCATAGVLGIASAPWFAWSLAGEELPVIPVVIAAVIGVAVGIAGFVLRGRVPGKSVHAGNPAAYRVYNRALLFEIVAIVAGNFALGRFGLSEYIPAWTMAMMGLHFFPLARLYRISMLRNLAWIVLACSGFGALSGIVGWTMPATVSCGLGALALLVTAVWAIRTVVRLNSSVSESQPAAAR